jgi:hypothetical protein
MNTPTPAAHTTRRQRTALQVKAYKQQPFTPQSTVQNDNRRRHALQHAVLQPRPSQPTASNPPANKQHTVCNTCCTALHLNQHQPWIPSPPRVTDTHLHPSGTMHPVASKPSCPAPDCPANLESIQCCSGCSSGSRSCQTGSQSLPLLPLTPATASGALRACTTLTIPIPAVPITHGPVVCDCLGPKPLSKVLPVLSIS